MNLPSAWKNRITGEIREKDTDAKGTGTIIPGMPRVDPALLGTDWEPLYTINDAAEILGSARTRPADE